MNKTILTGLCALLVTAGAAHAQSTAFTYQGRLNSATNPATGLYDFSFNLFGVSGGGSALTASNGVFAVPVTNGLFTLTLNFGNQFPGADRWLQIAVRTNGVGAYATLAPRQPLTATPYAIRALDAGTATTAATANSVAPGTVNITSLTSNAVDSSKILDGSIAVNDLSATLLTNTFWRLTGNPSTTAGVNFLGTTDNQALEMKVNNTRALRLEPNATSPNVLGGYAGNVISNGVAGGVIAGGGQLNNTNRVGGSFSTVGGGYNNSAYFGSAVVAGGDNNTAGQDHATVGGGFSNRALGLLSTVAGGDNNTASGQFSTVPGGSFSTAGADYALAAGRRAKATNAGAIVFADSQNADFGSTSNNQFIVRATGGFGLNTNNPQEALHVNGRYVRVEGLGHEQVYIGGDGVSNDAQLGSLNGSVSNVTLWNPASAQRMNLELARLDAYSANISGLLTATLSNATFTATAGSPPFGLNGNATKVPNLNADLLDGLDSGAFWKTTGNAGTAAGVNFVGTTDDQPFEARVNNQRVLRFEVLFDPANSPNLIGGFSGNSVSGVFGAAIGGGGTTGLPNRVNANYGVVAGGLGNSVFQNDSFIGGGIGNSISADRAVISGGRDNSIRTNASNAAIGGGRDNIVTGAHGAIPGGISNEATNNAFAAGTRAKAIRPGTFVWADSQNADFGSTASNQFLVRASGGAGFGTTTPTAQLDVSSTGGDLFPQLRIDHTSGSDYARLRFTQRGNYNHRWDLGAVSNSFSLYSGYFGREFLHGDGNGVSFGNNNVGIGTATPTDAILDIEGNVHLNDNDIFLRGGIDRSHGLGWYGSGKPFAGQNVDGPVLYGYAGGALGATENGITNIALRWNSSGEVTVKCLTILGGCDLAEPFPMKDETVEPGSVMVIDDEHAGQLKVSAHAYDTRVAGIVSGAGGVNTGLALRQQGVLDAGRNVALTGRVYVKADATHGAIRPGDLLTTSESPGHAMKVSDHTRAQGAILGKAMSALPEGQGMVLVLVTLQ